MLNLKKIFSVTIVALLVMQALVVLLSWMLSVIDVGMPVRSLLGGDGLRWLLRSIDDNIQTPLLSWLMLMAMGWGSVSGSGMLSRGQKSSVRRNFALGVVCMEIVFFLILFALLCLLPHAVLLDATGSLFNYDMIGNAITCLSIIMIVIGVSYAVFAETITSGDLFHHLLVMGLRRAVPVLIVYILCAELFATVKYAIG